MISLVFFLTSNSLVCDIFISSFLCCIFKLTLSSWYPQVVFEVRCQMLSTKGPCLYSCTSDLIWFLSWKDGKTYPSALAYTFFPRAFGFNTFWVMASDLGVLSPGSDGELTGSFTSPCSLPKCEIAFYRTQEKKGQGWLSPEYGNVSNWPSALFPLWCLGLERVRTMDCWWTLSEN